MSNKHFQRNAVWKLDPNHLVLAQLLQSVLPVAGQLSIDRSVHMNFTLLLHYQKPMYQLVER